MLSPSDSTFFLLEDWTQSRDLPNTTPSWQACQALCDALEECNKWAWQCAPATATHINIRGQTCLLGGTAAALTKADLNKTATLQGDEVKVDGILRPVKNTHPSPGWAARCRTRAGPG